GRFQNPAAGWSFGLKILEKAFLPFIGRCRVRMAQKPLVRGNTAGGNKFAGQKRITVNRHTFVRGGGAHRIDGVRLRCKYAKTPQAERRFANALLRLVRIIVPAPHREHHFPRAWRAVTWILSEQFMEVSRTASGNTNDEDRV